MNNLILITYFLVYTSGILIGIWIGLAIDKKLK